MASRSSASSSSSSSARLRSLLLRSETLGAETDVALARCESDLGRAAELVALTVARTQVREVHDEKNVETFFFFFFFNPSLPPSLQPLTFDSRARGAESMVNRDESPR